MGRVFATAVGIHAHEPLTLLQIAPEIAAIEADVPDGFIDGLKLADRKGRCEKP